MNSSTLPRSSLYNSDNGSSATRCTWAPNHITPHLKVLGLTGVKCQMSMRAEQAVRTMRSSVLPDKGRARRRELSPPTYFASDLKRRTCPAEPPSNRATEGHLA